ncbi:hypothetical protein PZ938_00130 [Luteipulveratus sp. YIM 133132]|uniref:hypothetical protein n=1 Tax=Luteipulveratus flavus TaxID=3031728 RepID=UPI0023B1648B|nr:hypothetical protein [Luteipulveratus sp. YIM 133132]MDE9364001.1 hypothetical protein [Luteipulveratus sp. YIM 133132]
MTVSASAAMTAGQQRVGAGTRTTALTLTAVAALVPTLLSADGMIGVGTDLLGLSVVIAAGLAVFLELALVAEALLARVAIQKGHHARADVAATWVISAVSGAISATHELIGATPAGERVWQHDAGSLLAAAVRLIAPLVAAWLWHRLLTADRHQADQTRTRQQVRTDRHLHAVAVAALAVRRRQDDTGLSATVARWKLDSAYRQLLRHTPATAPDIEAQIAAWCRRVGDVEALPALTRQANDTSLTGQNDSIDTEPVATDTGVATATYDTEPAPAADTASTATASVATDADTDTTTSRGLASSPVAAEPVGADTLADTLPVSLSQVGDSETTETTGTTLEATPGDNDEDERLAAAVAVLDEKQDRATGRDVVAELVRRGHEPVTERTGQRWLRRAQERRRPALVGVAV